jgi:hypothetical protein
MNNFVDHSISAFHPPQQITVGQAKALIKNAQRDLSAFVSVRNVSALLPTKLGGLTRVKSKLVVGEISRVTKGVGVDFKYVPAEERFSEQYFITGKLSAAIVTQNLHLADYGKELPRENIRCQLTINVLSGSRVLGTLQWTLWSIFKMDDQYYLAAGAYTHARKFGQLGGFAQGRIKRWIKKLYREAESERTHHGRSTK